MLVALPLVAGLSVAQGLVPPHPAATLAVAIFHADLGRTILYALVIGIPTAILAGPVYGAWVSPRIQLAPKTRWRPSLSTTVANGTCPDLGSTLFTVLLPVVLMLVGSTAGEALGSNGKLVQTLRLLGNDDVALLVGTLVSFYTLGRLRGFARETILRFSRECLAPTALITLLVGAGGGFGRVLQDSGVSHAIVGVALGSHVPLLLLAWLLAALMRLATGSATVAMTTAAGIVAPIALQSAYPHPELLAIATGAGSLIFSHVNDGGFWLVKEYFNMSVPQTIESWSVCETIISITALLLSMCAAYFSSAFLP